MSTWLRWYDCLTADMRGRWGVRPWIQIIPAEDESFHFSPLQKSKNWRQFGMKKWKFEEDSGGREILVGWSYKTTLQDLKRLCKIWLIWSQLLMEDGHPWQLCPTMFPSQLGSQKDFGSIPRHKIVRRAELRHLLQFPQMSASYKGIKSHFR